MFNRIAKISEPYIYQPHDNALKLFIADSASRSPGTLVKDLSKYNNDMTNNGATWVRGPAGQNVLSFDGTDDYLTQKVHAQKVGTITMATVAGGAMINDTGQDFTPYAGASGASKPYMFGATDTGEKVAWGYIGEEGDGEIFQLTPVQIAVVLVAGDAAADDYFGMSVSLSSDGSILAVGATSWGGGATEQGGVDFYDWACSDRVRRGSVLTASDAAAEDSFGMSVSLSSDGSILAVGATFWEGGATNPGGEYIYAWSRRAPFTPRCGSTASDAAAADRFGVSVSLSSDGSILAVGAIFWEGGATDQGGGYIYDWSGSAWGQRGSVLTASDAAADDSFGRSVSLSSDGSILAVGAIYWEGGATNQGGGDTYCWVFRAR